MKKFLLVLFTAGLTATAAFAQAGGPALTSSAPVSVSVNVSEILYLNITGGNAVNFVYDEVSDYDAPQTLPAYTQFRVRSNITGGYSVSALADSPTLTDAGTGASMIVGLLAINLAGASAPQPLSAITPISLAIGGAGDDTYSVDWTSNLGLADAAPGLYSGGVTITATKL